MTTQSVPQSTISTTSNLDRSRLARHALYADFAASASVMLLMVFAAAPLSTLMGMDDLLLFQNITGSTLLLLVGLSFIPILAFIAYVATRHPFNTRLAWVQVGLNMVWVVGCTLLLLTGALGLSTAGGWITLIQADCLLLITIAQIVGIRRLN